MKNYLVTLSVPVTSLGTVLEVTRGTAALVRVEEDNRGGDAATPPAKKRYANGHHRKSGDGSEAIVAAAKRSQIPITMAQVVEAIEPLGYAKSSAHPLVSQLIKSGRLVRHGNGTLSAAP